MKTQSKFFAQGYPTVFDEESGRYFPIPAGGDGTGEEKEETPSQEEEVEEEEEDEEVENFNGETFLQSIEEEELRNRLEPHVKKWDAGVTRRFQELHSRLKPYEELGDYERLQEAAQLYQILNERPEDVYRALSESLGQQSNVQQGQPGPQSQQPGMYQQQQYPQQQYQQQQQQQYPGQQQPGLTNQQQQLAQQQGLTQQQYAQLPPEYKQQLEQHGEILTTLAQAYIDQEKSKAQAEEDKALDEYLGNLKTEFGEFDEDYVLSKMANGVDGEKAVKQYHKAIHKAAAKTQNENAPQILSGGGQVGQDSVDVGKLGSKDVKSLVAGLVAQAQDT